MDAPDPAERVRLIGEMILCFEARNWTAWQKHLDRNVEWFPSSSLVDGRVYVGKEEVLAWVAGLVAGTTAYSLTSDLEGAEHCGDRTIIRVVATPTSPELAGQLPEDVHLVYTFGSGVVTSMHAHADEAAARRELRGERWRRPGVPEGATTP